MRGTGTAEEEERGGISSAEGRVLERAEVMEVKVRRGVRAVAAS